MQTTTIHKIKLQNEKDIKLWAAIGLLLSNKVSLTEAAKISALPVSLFVQKLEELNIKANFNGDLNLKEIIKVIQQHKKEFKSLGVEKIGIFGSFAEGRQRPDSDIDIIIKLKGEENYKKRFLSVHNLLSELLGRKIDLITENSLPTYKKALLNKAIYVEINN